MRKTSKSLARRSAAIMMVSLTFLVISTAIAPVFADHSQKIPVTYTRGGIQWTLGDYYWTTPENTYHSRGSTFRFSSYTVTGSGVNLVGSSLSIVDQNEDFNTGLGEQHMHTVITFPDGTFEGITQIRGIYKSYTSITYPGFLAAISTVQKAVYHGTGLYQGWTLELETATGQPVAGYLLIPNN